MRACTFFLIVKNIYKEKQVSKAFALIFMSLISNIALASNEPFPQCEVLIRYIATISAKDAVGCVVTIDQVIRLDRNNPGREVAGCPLNFEPFAKGTKLSIPSSKEYCDN